MKKYVWETKDCKSSKNWWILTFFMSEVAGDITMKMAAAAASPHLCNNPPCRPRPIITDIAKQICRGGNGSISLKKQRIWLNQAGGLSQRLLRWGWWRWSWCCNYIFRVRGDEAAGATEIVIVQNYGWLCWVGTGCTVHIIFCPTVWSGLITGVAQIFNT